MCNFVRTLLFHDGRTRLFIPSSPLDTSSQATTTTRQEKWKNNFETTCCTVHVYEKLHLLVGYCCTWYSLFIIFFASPNTQNLPPKSIDSKVIETSSLLYIIIIHFVSESPKAIENNIKKPIQCLFYHSRI